jgi:hypothetical protein
MDKTDQEDIGSFAEEFEEIRETLKEMESEFSGDYEAREDQEDEEEYSGSLGDDLKGYQERFRRYAESIKKEIRDYAPEERSEMAYAENRIGEGGIEEVKTPRERGHKLGCGCPGCAKYRELHGIDLEAVSQDPHLKFPDLRPGSQRSGKGEEYREMERRPCGGKHRHLFRGKRAEFKRLMGNYHDNLNLNLAGY